MLSLGFERPPLLSTASRDFTPEPRDLRVDLDLFFLPPATVLVRESIQSIRLFSRIGRRFRLHASIRASSIIPSLSLSSSSLSDSLLELEVRLMAGDCALGLEDVRR